MGRMGKNTFMKGTTGKVGVVVIRNSPTGPVMQNLPGRRDKSSPKQEEQNSKFKKAVRYGNNAKINPTLAALYERGMNARQPSVFHVAQNDYLNPPEIIYVKTDKYTGNIGDLIMIKAIDDFKVTEVSVVITDANGTLIEKGKALGYPRRPKLWLYRATAENLMTKDCVIKVKASDLPGNAAEMLKLLE